MRGGQEAEALLASANDKVAQARTLFLASKKSVGSQAMANETQITRKAPQDC